MPISLEEITNFLVHYCVKTFDHPDEKMIEKETATSDQTIEDATSGQTKAATTSGQKEKGFFGKVISQKWDAIDRTERKEQLKKSSNSQKQQQNDDYDDDDDITIVGERKREDKSPERDLPKDALSICRYKLSKVVPTENGDLNEFKEYSSCFNSLKMVKTQKIIHYFTFFVFLSDVCK